jgi:hypothetical protein
MAVTVVRYTIKPGLEERNAGLVRAVYAELAELRPAKLRYATYRLDDGRSFVHIADWTGDGKSPLLGLAAFREFQAGIADRCESGPVVGEAEEVGRFDGYSAAV